MLNRFLYGARAGAHHDNHALGIRRSDVIEEVVVSAGSRREAVHYILHNRGAGAIERIASLARLEKDIGVLGGSAQDRAVGRKRAFAVSENEFLVNQSAQVLVAQ